MSRLFWPSPVTSSPELLSGQKSWQHAPSQIGAIQAPVRRRVSVYRNITPNTYTPQNISNPILGTMLHEEVPLTPGRMQRLECYAGERYDDSSPVSFSPSTLPLPCAYLRIPWPRGKHFARLLPAREGSNGQEVHPAALAFRQYVKRMIVEDICSSPPYYLMRYSHFANLAGVRENMALLNSRITPFFFCRRAFPALQALSTQQAFLREPSNLFLNIKEVEHSQDDADIMVVHSILPPWERLPINYRSLEAAWVKQVVPLVSSRLLSKVRQRPVHLVVAYDCAQENLEWSHHNMRQVVHLIAQTVSVASSTMPLFLRPCSAGGVCAEGVVSRKQQAFDSFQVIVYPPRKFNEGVASLREKTCPAPTALEDQQSTYEPPPETVLQRQQRKAALRAMFENDRVQGRVMDSLEDNSTNFDDDDIEGVYPAAPRVVTTLRRGPPFLSRQAESQAPPPSSPGANGGGGLCGVFTRAYTAKPPRAPQGRSSNRSGFEQPEANLQLTPKTMTIFQRLMEATEHDSANQPSFEDPPSLAAMRRQTRAFVHVGPQPDDSSDEEETPE